jgi:hypothetical protein
MSRGKIIPPLNSHEVVARALDYVGNAKIHYHLQYPNGGTDPDDVPYDRDTGGCDCIGFALNVCGLDRFQDGRMKRWSNTLRKWGQARKFPLYDGYINTDSMIDEARTQGKWFTILKEPEDGCFIVGHSQKGLLRRKIGHIGVCVDTSEYKTKGLAGIQVVHCSPSNVNKPGNKFGSAVWKTNASLWAGYKDYVFIKFNYDYAVEPVL